MPDEKEPEDPSPEYVKGFNEGYILSYYAPEIGGVFGAYAPETERGKGFRAGKESFAPQPKKEPYPNYLKDASDNKKDMKLEKSTERKMAEFREAKDEQGLRRDRYPDWLRETDENTKDMGVERGQERDRSDMEREIE